MEKYRSFTDVEESHFRDHPEEIDDYISLIFEEYSTGGDTGALLSSLRVLSRKGIQKSLSENGTPGLASVSAIMHAIGYRLTPQRLNLWNYLHNFSNRAGLVAV